MLVECQQLAAAGIELRDPWTARPAAAHRARGQRKVRRFRHARDIHIPGAVQSDRCRKIPPGATQVGRPSQAPATRQFHEEGIARGVVNAAGTLACILDLQRSRSHREIGGPRASRDVRAAVLVHRNSIRDIGGCSAKKRRVDQIRACRIQFRHECVSEPLRHAAKPGLRGSRCSREVRRERVAAQIRRSPRVYRDGAAGVGIAAAEEGGVDRLRPIRRQLQDEGIRASRAPAERRQAAAPAVGRLHRARRTLEIDVRRARHINRARGIERQSRRRRREGGDKRQLEASSVLREARHIPRRARLIRTGGRPRKLRGSRDAAGHHDRARAIDRDRLNRCAADHRHRQHLRTRRIQLADESPGRRSARPCYREIRRIAIPRQVRIARAIDRDAIAGLRSRSPRVGRVGDHRVDHQRQRAVVLAQFEADFSRATGGTPPPRNGALLRTPDRPWDAGAAVRRRPGRRPLASPCARRGSVAGWRGHRRPPQPGNRIPGGRRHRGKPGQSPDRPRDTVPR